MEAKFPALASISIGYSILVAAICLRPDPIPFDLAISDILDHDARIGKIRNHACENQPLSTTVTDYVEAMREIDFSKAPNDFTEAFEQHIAAWEHSIPFMQQFPDLRGEMHDLFEEIRSSSATNQSTLEDHEKEIWGTWAEIERIAKSHGYNAD